jgi:uncharacterized protein YdaU (DUF1376 family)
MEDLAFRRMLDLFYESEKPLPFELPRVAKLIGMSDYQEEIRTVLNDFWCESEEGWINNRAADEIEKYKARVDSARANGKKGGRPIKAKITQSVNLANPVVTEPLTNHKPITNNHKPIKDLSFIEDGFDYWWNAYPPSRRVNKKGCLSKFKVLCKGFDEKQVEQFVNKLCFDVKQKVKNAKEIHFVVTTMPYLNQERYNDE